MGKKDKKKGKGAEKTAMKTERNAINKLKKELAAKGEVDVEKLIAEYQENSNKVTSFGEEPCGQPCPRSGFNLCSHPNKDELIMFGGEFFNGRRTSMFNDLHFYNIKKGTWSIMHCSLKPPPRSSAQAVVTSQNGGQLWVFGGEFASPSRLQFYHYKDLWMFSFVENKWQQIKAPGGPSARSGHRMVVSRKNIIIFGGFHESLSDYKYFNDVFAFNLESYTWSKVEATGKAPSPRSGCQMAAATDGRIFVYGGYSKEKIKKDVDKGITYSDMYQLQVDERSVPNKWKWLQVKPLGIPPPPRNGFSIAVAPNNHAYSFGGVQDEEMDEKLTGTFFNDLFCLDLESGHWQPVNFRSKSVAGAKKKRRRAKEKQDDEEEDEEDGSEMADSLDKVNLTDTTIKSSEDSIFTVTVGPSSSQATANVDSSSSIESTAFIPKARMKASMTIKGGILYMYGGQYEEENRQLTLSDFYSLDIRKLDEWRTIIPFSTSKLEWIDSEESESSDTNTDDMGEEEESDTDDSG